MKKKIPLTVLEFVQPIVLENSELIHQIKDEKTMFHLLKGR